MHCDWKFITEKCLCMDVLILLLESTVTALISNPGHENGPFANVVDKLDVFVPCHFFGWWVKVGHHHPLPAPPHLISVHAYFNVERC